MLISLRARAHRAKKAARRRANRPSLNHQSVACDDLPPLPNGRQATLLGERPSGAESATLALRDAASPPRETSLNAPARRRRL
ncbi:Hypothetical protein BN69_2201 [Methylocystis sp. SC2]|nr:Hypothetical protein BN69_2201 [Methylocystis sp. SC2]